MAPLERNRDHLKRLGALLLGHSSNHDSLPEEGKSGEVAMNEVENVVQALFETMTVEMRRDFRVLEERVAALEGKDGGSPAEPQKAKKERKERLLNQNQAAAFLGCSREYIRLKRREGDFPEPLRLSARDLRWPVSVLETWARDQELAAADKATT